LDIIYKSSDGKEFATREACELYEERVNLLVANLIELGLSEKLPGDFLSKKIGVPREFLPQIRLMDPNLEIIERLNGARHLAEFMDSYVVLGKWLEQINQIKQSS